MASLCLVKKNRAGIRETTPNLVIKSKEETNNCIIRNDGWGRDCIAAAPKGQANLANSQANELQPDRTLESTPPIEGVSPTGSHQANLSGRRDRDRKEDFFRCLFLFISMEVHEVDRAAQNTAL